MGFSRASTAAASLWDDLLLGKAEAVHEVRKLTRKVQTELRVAGTGKKTSRVWGRLRRSLAPVRDHDATGEHLSAALAELKVPALKIRAFQHDWAAARQQHFRALQLPELPPLVHRSHHWKRRARKLLARDRHQLLLEGAAVLCDPPDLSPPNLLRWHTLRKHLKRYRYTLELLEEAPPELVEILDALGRLQDAQVVRDLLEREGWLPEWREVLLEREKQSQRQAQERMLRLWAGLAAHLGMG